MTTTPRGNITCCSAAWSAEDRAAAGRQGTGSALVIVLWVIGLLSILVASFTFDAQMETKITSWYRKRTKAQYLAKSGIEIAEMLMRKMGEVGKAGAEKDIDDRWWGAAKNLSEGLAVRDLVEPLGSGEIHLDMVPEPARRNVNLLRKEEDWERVLDVGGITEDMQMWPDLIESFLDWIDRDETPRDNGAETEDYYATLEDPYKSKNGALDTVEELLLVKGFNPAIVSGGILEEGDENEEPLRIPGIKDLLTTYGDGKVNVNAATKRVLMTLPGVDELVADAVLEEREGWTDDDGEKIDASFENINDFFERIPDIDRSLLQRHITTGSKIFRVTSVGQVGNVKNKIWCIVKYSAKQMTILRWREED